MGKEPDFSSKVQIGLVGGELHTFDYKDVLNGAVQESGLIPELKDLPRGIIETQVTGVERKYHEHVNALRMMAFDMRLVLPPAILPRQAFKDSKEDKQTSEEIAVAKIHDGFLNILTNYMNSLSLAEQRSFKKELCQRLGLKSFDFLIASSDDRDMVLDHIFLEPLFGEFRDHWNPQVRDIFKDDHGVPGKRVKEIFNADYGVLNSVYNFQTVARMLKHQGKDIDELHVMNTTLSFKSVSGLLLPEKGIIVKAEGAPAEYKEITSKDFERVLKGRIYDFDHINLVDWPSVPKGTTLFDLKQKDPQHDYLKYAHSPSIARIAFASALGVPKLPKNKSCVNMSAVTPYSEQKPKTVISTASMISGTPPEKEISGSLRLPIGLKLSKERGAFDSLFQMERKLNCGQAFVVQDPTKFSVPMNGSAVKDKWGYVISDKDLNFLRLAETALMNAYLNTLATVSGSPNHFARPNMVEQAYYKKYGKWHGDLCNLGLTGDAETEAYKLFKDRGELEQGLRSFDAQNYQHHVSFPHNDYVDIHFIKEILGLEDLGYVISEYGAASSYLDKAHKTPRDISYETAKFAGLKVDGGGKRSAMLGMMLGNLRALEEGYDVLNLGVLSMSDVTPIEEDALEWAISKGHDVRSGNDPRHFTFAGGHMHVLKLDRLMQRQALIAGLSDLSILYPGGKGTIVEAAITVLHNAGVVIRGEGILGHDRMIPLVLADHKFNYMGHKRQVFDAWKACTFEDAQQMERFGVYSFTDNRDVVDFTKQYGDGRHVLHSHPRLGVQKMNFDISERKIRNYVHGARLDDGLGTLQI